MARVPAGRHPANAISLVLGIILCGVALGWLLFTLGAVTLQDLRWALPGVLTGAGLAGILASLGRGRTRGDGDRRDWRR